MKPLDEVVGEGGVGVGVETLAAASGAGIGHGGALPPAVVLGIDTPIGLAIIRDLGARGVAVHGIARDVGALGLASRFLRRAYLRAAGADALLLQLLALGRELGPACLFAIAESDIALLNGQRERLAGYKLMFADAARMAQVLDKRLTYAAARAAGLHVPRTEQVVSLAQARALAATLRYPVVLKWGDPNVAAPLLAAAGLALHKARYCDTPAQLLASLRRYEVLQAYPLIQEYCPGYGLGQFVLMSGGRAHYLFQHRRLHEWPPEGGFSSLCEALPLEQHRALMAQSVALLRALDWEGVAMVEYRHDPVTGRSALMEVNGRFWGSLPLACQAGAAFPWFCYLVLGLGRAVGQTEYRGGLRCRFMIPETKRLLRILFRQRAIADRRLRFRRGAELAAYLGGFFRPLTCYQVFAWSDPRPFVRDTLQLLRKLRR